jgi:hypothetical protein
VVAACLFVDCGSDVRFVLLFVRVVVDLRVCFLLLCVSVCDSVARMLVRLLRRFESCVSRPTPVVWFGSVLCFKNDGDDFCEVFGVFTCCCDMGCCTNEWYGDGVVYRLNVLL